MTITIDKTTLDLIKRKVGPRGVSKFIADAARDHAARNELRDYLRELDDKYGRPTPEMFAETDREMRKHFGMPPPTRPWNPYEDEAVEKAQRTSVKQSKARKRGKPRTAIQRRKDRR